MWEVILANGTVITASDLPPIHNDNRLSVYLNGRRHLEPDGTWNQPDVVLNRHAWIAYRPI